MADTKTLRLTDLQAGHSAAEVGPVLRGPLLALEGGMMSGNATEVVARYKTWAEAADRTIGNVLNRTTVTGWFHDEMYWLITERNLAAVDQAPTFDMMRYDIDRRRAHLTTLKEQADQVTQRWDGSGDIVILDTSMIRAVLGKPQNNADLTDVLWNQTMNSRNGIRLVLPLAVLSELDRTKRPSSKAPEKARAALKWIDNTIESVDQPKTLRAGSILPGGEYDLSIEFYIEPFEASTDDTDQSIVQTTATLQRLTPSRVVLGTRDTSMRWRAQASGVTSFKFPLPAPTHA